MRGMIKGSRLEVVFFGFVPFAVGRGGGGWWLVPSVSICPVVSISGRLEPARRCSVSAKLGENKHRRTKKPHVVSFVGPSRFQVRQAFGSAGRGSTDRAKPATKALTAHQHDQITMAPVRLGLNRFQNK